MSLYYHKEVDFTFDEATKKFVDGCGELKDQLAIIREETRKRVDAFFKEHSKFIFEKFPWVKSIKWTQYTPGFCDGDPCTFTSTHDDFKINGLELCELSPKEVAKGIVYYDEDTEEDKVFDAGIEEVAAAVHAIHAFLTSFSDDDVLDMFGNDVEVNVTPKGVDLDSYECGY